MEIREIIELKIKEAKLTKRDVADRMGIIPNNINSMISNPSWPTLKKLADAIGITVSELVEDYSEKEEKPSIVCPYCHQKIELNPSRAEKVGETAEEKTEEKAEQ